MALSYTAYGPYNNNPAGSAAISSASISYTAGQPIVVEAEGPVSCTIADTAALTWVSLGTNTTNGQWQTVWYAIPAGAGSTTITVTQSSGTSYFSITSVRTYTGAGTPGNFISGSISATAAATAFSQSITPTASGSAVWLSCCASVGPGAPTAASLNTLYAQLVYTGNTSGFSIGPTTQPLTSSASFTLGGTTTADFQQMQWIAYEVPASVTSATGSSAGQVGGLPGIGALLQGASSASGSGTTTESPDTSAGTGTLNVSGAGTTTEGADTSAATGTLNVSGSSATTDSADTSAGTGTTSTGVTGSGASTDGADTSAGTGATTLTGASATTDSADSSAGTGTETLTATGATTEGADTSAASGSLNVAGSGATTDSADVSTGSGSATVGVTGTGTTQDGSDTSAGSGSTAVSGAGASTDSADASAGTGAVNVDGSGSTQDATDTSTASGAAVNAGSGAMQDGADTSAGVGAAVNLGTGTTTDPADTSAGTGSTGAATATGTGTTQDPADTSSAAGTFSQTLSQSDILLLWQIYKLHGLSSDPLVVSASGRSAGDISQTVVSAGPVSVSTTATSAAAQKDASTMIQELAALHGITAPLVTTPVSRSAGSITQTITVVNGVTTVTRV